MRVTIQPASHLLGSPRLPGDKSIAHRALLFAAMATGESVLENWSLTGVTERLRSALNALGIQSHFESAGCLRVVSPGWKSLTAPGVPIDCGGSATTLRFLMGFATGIVGRTILDGHAGLRRRPMERVAEPLRCLGASVSTSDGCAPVTVEGGSLRGTCLEISLPSAQVQTAVIVAALGAEGPTRLRFPVGLRDHTVRLMRHLELRFQESAQQIIVQPAPIPTSALRLPGDVSAAAFFVAAALLTPGSRIHLQDVGANPTRTGLWDVLRSMGATLRSSAAEHRGVEPTVHLDVEHQALKSTEIRGELVTRMIDEFPILAVLALSAEGSTIVRDATELRLKESDRITAMAYELARVGGRMLPLEDGFRIDGPQRLRGGTVNPRGDHRLAMAFSVAALTAEGPITVDDAEIVAESNPGFFDDLRALGARVDETW